MDIEQARGLAAQCWCEPETSGRVMDPPLAEAIARKIVAAVEQARLEEREACAKLCEAHHTLIAESLDGYDIAAAIRARGDGVMRDAAIDQARLIEK